MPIHQRLFLVLVFLLPTQLAYHFWPTSSFIFGIRVDYLAPTVYLTDILVGLVLVSWLWQGGPRRLRNLFSGRPLIYFSTYLLFTSLAVSQNQPAALLKLVKILELYLLGFYFYRTWTKKLWQKVKAMLSLAMLYTTALALGQFFLKGSVGGPLWWLGERTFSAGAPGIAQVVISGQAFLRPYATLPHPNSLAGFMLVSAALLWPAKNLLLRVGLTAAALSLFLSFSQGAWISAATVVVLGAIRKRWPKKITLCLAWLLGLVFFLTLAPLLFLPPTGLPEELSTRWGLAQVARKMFLANPLFGVGLNNFVVRLPEFSMTPQISWWLQPVHNIFLLVAAETGIIGLGFFVWLLLVLLKKMENARLPDGQGNWKMATALAAILLTGTVDHYWFTLQQNQLLLALVLGLNFAERRKVA